MSACLIFGRLIIQINNPNPASKKEKTKKRYQSANGRKKAKKVSVPTVVDMWEECSSHENAKKYFIEKKVLSERSNCSKEISVL